MALQTDLRSLTCSNFLPLLAVCVALRFICSCGFLRLDFQLLAVRLSTSCVSKVLAGKPQKHDILTSCGGLRVLTAQELLAALLARALFLGCSKSRTPVSMYRFDPI